MKRTKNLILIVGALFCASISFAARGKPVQPTPVPADTAIPSAIGNANMYLKSDGSKWVITQPPSYNQVQADWNTTTSSALSFIKNKPVIPVLPNFHPVATSGDYNSLNNKPTIPAAVPQVQSDFAETNTSSPAYIKNKPVVSDSSDLTIVNVTASYTLNGSEGDKKIVFNAASPVNLTVPTDTVVIRTGFLARFVTIGDGIVTIVPASGVTLYSLNDAKKSAGVGAAWELNKIGANKWHLAGQVVTGIFYATVGQQITLTPESDGTSYTYVWRKNGTAISGATRVNLTLTNVQTSDSGVYTVVLTNASGSSTSESFNLTVSAP